MTGLRGQRLLLLVRIRVSTIIIGLYSLTITLHLNLSFIAPDPPANLSINVRQKNHVQFSWDPPGLGGFSKFKLRLISHSDPAQQPRNFIEEKSPVKLSELVAGASYEIQLYTIFENKESTAYISGNFTTSNQLFQHLPSADHILNNKFKYSKLLCCNFQSQILRDAL